MSAIGALFSAAKGYTTAFTNWFTPKLTELDTSLAGVSTINRSIYQGVIYGTGTPYPVSKFGDFKTANLGQGHSVYVHIKLPLNRHTRPGFFAVRVYGYSYGTARLIDEWFSGLINLNSTTIEGKRVSGYTSPDCYLDSNGNVVLSLYFTSLYYPTMTVDSQAINGTPAFTHSELDSTVSLSAQVVFQ